MATLSKGYTFGATEQVTNTKLHSLVDDGTVTEIVNADIDATAAIIDTKLAQIYTAGKVSGHSFTLLSSIPSGAGYIPPVNLGSGASIGIQYLRGDQTWQTLTDSDEKVKADSSDPTADYLDGKVDGTTIEVDSSNHYLYVLHSNQFFCFFRNFYSSIRYK
jgi:hypothetical protein